MNDKNTNTRNKNFAPKYDVSYFRDIEVGDVLDTLGIKVVKNRFTCPVKTAHKNGDKNPSASIVPQNKRKWHCFACGEKGDAISLVQKYQNCSFTRAQDWLYENGFVDGKALIKEDERFPDTIPDIPPFIRKAAGIYGIRG